MASMPALLSSKAADTYGSGLSVSERGGGLLLVSLLLALSCSVAVDSLGSLLPCVALLYLLVMDPF